MVLGMLENNTNYETEIESRSKHELDLKFLSTKIKL